MRHELAEIDAALLDMRRLWAPTTSGRSARGEDPGIDLSTVLVVHTLGSAEGGLAVTEIAEHLGVAPTTASRLCDRAVAAGFVQKAQADSDARRLALTLTPAGLDLWGKSFAFRLDYLRRILHDWDAAEITTFQQLLTRFAATVHANPPLPPPPFTFPGDGR